MEPNKQLTLNRTLGMKEGISITTGTVIGVGLFVTGAQCVGAMGAGIFLLTFIALLVCIFPTLMYAEMGAALPYAGGTYNYAKRAINLPVANIAAWHYLMALIALVSTESLAFSNYFAYMLKALGVSFTLDDRIVAAILMIVFIFVNYRGVKFSGIWQNIFVYFFWATSGVWMLLMISHVEFANYIPEQLATFPGFKAWVEILCWMWWCYAGFETCVGMGGEIKYPQINIPHALILSPFLIFCVTALYQYFLAGLVPADLQSQLSASAAPYPEGLELAGYAGFPLVLICISIAFGADFSTINPSIECPARYIYQMAVDGVLPKVCSKVHPKYRTPHVAIIIVAVIAYLLLLTDSITFVAQINICSLFWSYIIGFISFWQLRRKEPNLERPFKCPMPIVATVSSVIIYALMCWSCGWVHVGISFIITGVSLGCYFIFARHSALSPEEILEQQAAEAAKLAEDIPTPEDALKMKKEFRNWSVIVGVLTAGIIVLYVVSFIL